MERKAEIFENTPFGFYLKSNTGRLLSVISRIDGSILYDVDVVIGAFTPDSVRQFLIKDDAFGKPCIFIKVQMDAGDEYDWPCGEVSDVDEATKWVNTINHFYEGLRKSSTAV